MPIAKSDIQFYLTSVEPDLEQTIPSQSLGGYSAYVPSDATKSVVYPKASLAADSGMFGTTLTLSALGNMTGAEYLSDAAEEKEDPQQIRGAR